MRYEHRQQADGFVLVLLALLDLQAQVQAIKNEAPPSSSAAVMRDSSRPKVLGVSRGLRTALVSLTQSFGYVVLF